MSSCKYSKQFIKLSIKNEPILLCYMLECSAHNQLLFPVSHMDTHKHVTCTRASHTHTHRFVIIFNCVKLSKQKFHARVS